MIIICIRSEPDPKAIYFFGKATRGNWRNSLYVDGSCETCVKRRSECGDFLFTLSSDGAPIILPAKTIAELSWESIDKTECVGAMTLKTLMTLINHWIILNIDSADTCPLEFFSEYYEKLLRQQRTYEKKERIICDADK